MSDSRKIKQLLEIMGPPKEPIDYRHSLAKVRCPHCNKMYVNCVCYKIYNQAREKIAEMLADEVITFKDLETAAVLADCPVTRNKDTGHWVIIVYPKSDLKAIDEIGKFLALKQYMDKK